MSANENEDSAKKYPIRVVDEDAARLAKKYDNAGWIPFYCKGIYAVGFSRIHELETRADSAKEPAKLFTKLLKEEIDIVSRRKQIKKIKEFGSDYGAA